MARTATPRIGTGLVLAAVLAATVLAVAVAGTAGALEGNAADALIALRSPDRAPKNLLVVAVDTQTQSKYRGLPLRRRYYAEVIRRLDRMGARVIDIDVQFTEASGHPDDDEALFDAIDDAKAPVVLATSQRLGPETDYDTAVLGGRANLIPLRAVAAHSGVLVDHGVVRTVKRQVDHVPSQAEAMAEAFRASGNDERIAAWANGRAPRVAPRQSMLFDPAGGRDTVPVVSMLDVNEGAVPDAAVRGRIVIVGVRGLGADGDDEHQVAGSRDRMTGVELQAQATDTILRGAPLHDGGTASAWVLALFAGVATALATGGRLRRQVIVAFLLAITLVAFSVAAVLSGLLVNPVPAAATILIAGAAALLVRAAQEQLRRAEARATLARFVPPSVVDQVLDGGTDGQLPPRAQTATVVFCDLRGYTSLVAHLGRPEDLITVLGTYLDAVTSTIHAHGGTVVSFQGDGVMSAFGAPIESDGSAARAIAAARALQDDALPQIRAALSGTLPQADGLALGIGIATGQVFAGTVGPSARREYAVVGPTTNLAARLQALTKTEGVHILIDDATANAAAAAFTARSASRPAPALRPIGPRAIRGLPAPIALWTTDEEPPAAQDT
jgi:adenylate cyclase